MKKAALLVVFVAVAALGQEKPCQALSPDPQPCGAGKSASPTLAVLDDEPVTLADVDEKIRKSVEGLDKDLAEAREHAIRTAVDDLLIDSEAKRRSVSAKQLLYDEVIARVAAPTDADVKSEIASKPDRYKSSENTDLAWGRLYERRVGERRKEFIASLETRYPVTIVPPTGTPSADAVVATVGKRRLVWRDVSPLVEAAETDVRVDVAQDEKDAVEEVVQKRLLAKEAARRGVSEDELTRTEVTAKIAAPTDAELEAEWRKYIGTYGPDFAKVRDEIADEMKWRRKYVAEQAFKEKLLAGHTLQWKLEVPKGAKREIALNGQSFRGPANAPVTLIEFGDYQCPPCGRMWSTTHEALQPYADRVRFVFMQHPLSIHRNAEKAAEAALAARAQGKFFEYSDVLFAHRTALDIASLEKYAADLGLNTKRFNSDLESGRYAPDVMFEKNAGARAGVWGTPTYFLNGVKLGDDAYTMEGMRRLVKEALGE